MTTEEKAKAYDEALERARVLGDGKHFVPHGMTVKEYIFPELRESEDERIRKALVWHLKAGEDFVSNGVTKAECIAYLEKQKEPENVSASTMAPSCWEVEQKEPKPKEPGYKHEDYFCERCQANAFNAGRESVLKEQKPAEWSEEDERRIDAICELLENTSAIHPNYSRRKLIIWLKSLRPSWKPSDHQMNILKAVKEHVGRGSGYWGEGLGSLIEDLEKLM